MGAPLAVVAAVIRRGERILVTRRPLDKANPGQWEFPGGKIGDGESPEAALVREILEELACTISVGERLTTVTHRYPELTVELHAYEASLLVGEPWAFEPLAVCWTAADALHAFALSEADRTIAAALVPAKGS
jgi:8-oxo-dGTP diphosphatase